MKYITLIILTVWSIWVMITYPNLRPKDNYSLWLLCVATLTVTVVNWIIILVEATRKK